MELKVKYCIIYFSGTGNTEFVAKKIKKSINETGNDCDLISIENDKNASSPGLINADLIIFAYPIYGSMAPRIIRDYIHNNYEKFIDKPSGVIVTQDLFSGDGGAFLARILRKYGIKVVDIEHFAMPTNLSDADIFKIKNGKDNDKKINKTTTKIEKYVNRLLIKQYKRIGDNIFSRILGLFQRLSFQFAEKYYIKNFHIDNEKCTLCAKCLKICPTDNLYIVNDTLSARLNCTLCYRCVNQCPAKALSIMTKKKPKVQYLGPMLGLAE